MTLSVTLTRAEAALLTARLQDANDTLEAVLHRMLAPVVREASEKRLQRLADLYRGLTPDQQADAIAVLDQWAIDNGIPT